MMCVMMEIQRDQKKRPKARSDAGCVWGGEEEPRQQVVCAALQRAVMMTGGNDDCVENTLLLSCELCVGRVANVCVVVAPPP